MIETPLTRHLSRFKILHHNQAMKLENKFGKAGAHSAVFELELEGLRAGIPAKNRATTNSLNTVSERDGYTSRK